MNLKKVGKRIDKKPVRKDCGSIYDENSIFMSQSTGTGTCGDVTYDVSLSLSGAAIVRSDKTKQSWVLTLKDMIELAIANGVDEPQDFESHD